MSAVLCFMILLEYFVVVVHSHIACGFCGSYMRGNLYACCLMFISTQHTQQHRVAGNITFPTEM